MTGIAMRYIKEWDIVPDPNPVRIVWVPSALYYPLSGHRGDCDKVTRATITGASDVRCSCGAEKS